MKNRVIACLGLIVGFWKTVKLDDIGKGSIGVC